MPIRPPHNELGSFRPRDERRGGPFFEQRRPHDAPPIPDPRRYRDVRRRRGIIRLTIEAVGALIVLAAVAAGLFTVFAPVELIRDRLVLEVKQRTGRDLVIGGRTTLSFWPRLSVSMGEVSLSAPPAMKGPALVTMKRLDAHASLSSLLLRRIEIDRVKLTDPLVTLRIDAGGRRSWDFAALSGPSVLRYAQAAPAGSKSDAMPPELADFLRNSSNAPPPAATGKARNIGNGLSAAIAISRLSIVNGTLRYHDERSNRREQFKAVNADVEIGSLASPVSAKGRFALRQETVSFQTRLSSPMALAERRSARLALQFAAASGSGRFEGIVRANPALAFPALNVEGPIEFDTGSLRDLLALAGLQIPAGNGLAATAVKGNLTAGPTTISLANAIIVLDGTTAAGDVTADFGSARPLLTANLQVGRLDIDRYRDATQAGSSSYRPAAAPPASRPAKAPSIEDLIRGTVETGRSSGPDRPRTPAAAPAGPRVKGFAQRVGWSEEPIDAHALGLVDAQLMLSLTGIRAGGLDFGATRLSIALKDAALRLIIEEARLYDGRASGLVTAKGNGPELTLGANLVLDNVASGPMLKAAGGTPWITGKTSIKLALGGRGTSERQIIDSLNGKVETVVRDGAITGYDVGRRIAALGQGKFTGFDPVAGEHTPFTEAGATFVVTSGTARSKDIRLVSPELGVTGGGTIALGPRRLDLTLRPSLRGAPARNGTSGELAGLELPFRVRGTWDRPQIAPDVDAVIANPDKAIDAVDRIGRKYGAKGLGDTLRGLLGRRSRGNDDGSR